MSSPSEFHSQIATDFDDLYQKSPDFIQRYEVWTQLLTTHIPEGARVLDLGCGSGVFSFFLAARGCSVLGIDGAANMIALCEQRRLAAGLDRVSFQQAELPLPAAYLPEASFDAVISSSVLEYIDDLPAIWQNIDRALKPGGVLIVSFPNRSSWYRQLESWLYKLTGKPAYFRYVKHVITVETLDRHLPAYRRLAAVYYANRSRRMQLFKALLPIRMASNLFAGVYQKTN